MQCKKCLYDSSVIDLSIDDDGICNYCIRHGVLEEEYPNDHRGAVILDKMVTEIKQKGAGQNYDCVVGISGGCDSSYLLDFVKKRGLNHRYIYAKNRCI